MASKMNVKMTIGVMIPQIPDNLSQITSRWFKVTHSFMIIVLDYFYVTQNMMTVKNKINCILECI